MTTTMTERDARLGRWLRLLVWGGAVVAWLIPLADFDYGLAYNGVNVVPRSDGICVQAVSGGDMRGYGEDSLVPDRAEADEAVASLAALYASFGRARAPS